MKGRTVQTLIKAKKANLEKLLAKMLEEFKRPLIYNKVSKDTREEPRLLQCHVNI